MRATRLSLPWISVRYSAAYFAAHGDPGDLEALKALFEGIGVHDEILATRVLIKHDNLVE